MTHDLKALRELEKRLAEAKGPDREIDAVVTATMDGMATIEIDRKEVWAVNGPDRTRSRLLGWIDPGKSQRNFSIYDDSTPSLTASLDAAVALVERVLPGWEWERRCETIRGKFVRLIGPEYHKFSFMGSHNKQCTAWQFAETPALALCLACVRALISQGEQ